MRRAYWIIPILLAQAGCARTGQSARPPSSPALAKAAAYLWSRQADDGGWHSHTYGLLRSGQSLTPFVLEALLQVPEAEYPLPGPKVDRAIALSRETYCSVWHSLRQDISFETSFEVRR